MENTKHHSLVLLLSLLLFSQNCLSWSWIFSSRENSNPSPSDDSEISSDAVAEFSMETPSSQKGSKLLENAKRKMTSSNSCWQKAYGDLFSGCSKALEDEEGRSRFAWRLSDCFQKDSGRPPFPHCDKKSTMLECLVKLGENSRNIYLEFYLETNSICHQLQIEAFKRQTERLVNELKNSALYAEEKLESIERKAEDLLRSSREIYDSLASIDMQTQHIVGLTKNVEDRVGTVLNHSEAVYEQSKKIATSQAELQEGQAQMKSKLEESMEGLHESYVKVLGVINILKDEAEKIEKKINEVGDLMSSKMDDLRSKADDIENITGVSLDKQKQLLDGQSEALEGLRSLTAFQSQAIEESRVTLQHIIQLGNKQQDELLQRQEELQTAHDRLTENSRTMLEAQEAFEAKQASMFVALDKLFTLHNAMLLESRLIKSFIVYSLSIFILYMFTSTKQTYSVRSRLYIELCVAILIEYAAQRHATYKQQTWIISLIRPLFAIVASAQLLQAVFTYRDYEVLNYRMLLELCANMKEQFNSMRERKELEWESDSEVNWSSWVRTELPDDVDNDEDPDYILAEQVGENSLATSSSKTKKYNLRSRRLQ